MKLFTAILALASASMVLAVPVADNEAGTYLEGERVCARARAYATRASLNDGRADVMRVAYTCGLPVRSGSLASTID